MPQHATSRARVQRADRVRDRRGVEHRQGGQLVGGERAEVVEALSACGIGGGLTRFDVPAGQDGVLGTSTRGRYVVMIDRGAGLMARNSPCGGWVRGEVRRCCIDVNTRRAFSSVSATTAPAATVARDPASMMVARE